MKPEDLCMGCMEAKGEELICPQCGYREEEEPASPFYLPPGTILEGKYLLGRVLGQGGFGITYIAWDTNLKIKLAIKEYFPQELASRSIGENHISAYIGSKSDQYQYGLGKFLQEAQTLAQFDSHPNIVSVRDYFQSNGTAYLVMSYVDGVTLKEYLAQSGGRLPVKQATGIIMPVLDALKEVHSVNIMHRDISPDNIYINRRGQVILLDFGAARQAVSEHGRSLSIILKPGYAPEEQYRTRGEQGPWTDIYAVAATYYHLVTGVQPPEALERLVEDELKTPSALKADLSPEEEQALLKAMAVRAGDRFQNVAEYQEALVGLSSSAYTAVPVKAPASVAGAGTTAPLEPKSPAATAGLSPQASAAATQKAGSRKSKGLFIGLAIGVVAIIAVVGFIGSQQFLTVSEIAETEVGLIKPEEKEEMENGDFTAITDLDADYYIDYENGTIPLGNLPIGARVVDPSWEWEFRTSANYSGSGAVKPVVWLIVARDHYEGLDSHVTLLSEELIGQFTYDNSTHVTGYGYNHWGESGTHSSATRGLRPWLNSTGIHAGEGFYQAFSESFKLAVLTTTVPNKEWQNGSVYSTSDHVFIPSETELGDTNHTRTYSIGKVYAYLTGAGDAERRARLDGATYWYWTRSPASDVSDYVKGVNSAGNFAISYADSGGYGVRPALNLKSGILVSEIRD